MEFGKESRNDLLEYLRSLDPDMVSLSSLLLDQIFFKVISSNWSCTGHVTGD